MACPTIDELAQLSEADLITFLNNIEAHETDETAADYEIFQQRCENYCNFDNKSTPDNIKIGSIVTKHRWFFFFYRVIDLTSKPGWHLEYSPTTIAKIQGLTNEEDILDVDISYLYLIR